MEHSSKRNPCPICFRDTNDKCRWNEHAILCFVGDSFHPPLHLLLNDTIVVGKKNWKLIRTNSGFAGSSYLFVKVDNLHQLSPLQRQKKIKNRVKNVIHIKNAFKDTRDMVFKSLSAPSFETLTYDEFIEYKAITHRALDSCESLMSLISVNRSQITLKKFTVEALRYWRKKLKYHLTDFLVFEIKTFGVTLGNKE